MGHFKISGKVQNGKVLLGYGLKYEIVMFEKKKNVKLLVKFDKFR